MEYIARKILMVRPAAFGFNPETSESNSFQKIPDLPPAEVRRLALLEFDRMVQGLLEAGIEVVVIEDPGDPETPDSVFPNNWFSTHPDGTLCIYPMEAPARRLERQLASGEAFKAAVKPSRSIDLTGFESLGKYLEGTGSLVLDHQNKVAYASLSSRTDRDVLDFWTGQLEFETVVFNSEDDEGKAIYHTNVLMTLGDNFAVICTECIPEESERDKVVGKLTETGKEIIEISRGQMDKFAGNMILLQNQKAEKILVMSERARNSLRPDQIERLESHARLAAFDIPIIEDCGGGSVRCMIAEIF